MRRGLSRKVLFLVIIGVCAALSGPPKGHAQPWSLREYQIKAAFLYNFLKFIDWPSGSLPETSDTITVCLLAEEPLMEFFESIKGKIVKGRRLAIRRIEGMKDLEPCHVLFVGSSEERRLAQIMPALQGSRVLTVGEVEGFLQSGGIINFVIEKNKVRFEINVNSAARAGLKLSSHLLGLAKVVRQ